MERHFALIYQFSIFENWNIYEFEDVYFVKYYIDNNNVCFSLISGEIYLMFKVGVISMKIGQNFLELHELTNAKIYLG